MTDLAARRVPPASAGLVELFRRNPDFARLFLGTLVSMTGDWFAFVAVSGFVTGVTGRPSMAALVYGASVVPVFLTAPLAGIVGDRSRRKRILVTVDILRIAPALGLVAALRAQSPWLAVACVAATASLSTFFEPISAAIVPNLVHPSDLPRAQAAMGSVWGSTLCAGAALGGISSATLGREACVYLNAATFAISALLVAGIRRPMEERPKASSPEGFAAGWSVAWREAKRRLVTRSLLVAKSGVGLGNGIVGMLPAFVVARFGGGDAAVGVLLAARGVGALLGPLVAHRASSDRRRIVFLCGASTITYGLSYALLPWSPTLWTAAACVVVAHLGGGAQWVLSTYGLQATTQDSVRGRIFSIDFALATLAMGVSAAAGGLAAEWTGLNASIWLLAAVSIVFGLAWLAWTRPLWRRTRALPQGGLTTTYVSCEPE